MLKPQPAVLHVWRTILVLCTFAPAFLTSLLFDPGTPIWLGFTAGWVVLFFFFYLFYLPVRYKKLSFAIKGNYLVMTSGVFYNRIRTMPLDNIQYSSMWVSPLDTFWGLGTLVVTAPGGRLRIPGLRRQDAENLAAILPSEWHRDT